MFNYNVYLHGLYPYRQLQFVEVLIRQHTLYNNNMYDPCYLWNLKTFKQSTWWVWKSSPTKQQLTIIYNLHLLHLDPYSLYLIQLSYFMSCLWFSRKRIGKCLRETHCQFSVDSLTSFKCFEKLWTKIILWNILIR